MKIPKLKPFELIEIIWEDSMGTRHPWYSKKEYQEWRDDDVMIKTIGYFQEVHKGKLYLVRGFTFYLRDNQTEDLQSPFSLPMGCIKKIRKLK